MIINEEDKKIIIACLAVMLLSAAGLWFFNAGRNYVSDIGKRTDTVREQLADAGRAQQSEAEAIDSAEDAVTRGSESIRDSQQTTGEIERTERTDAEIIRQSQSILERVRARGKTESSNQN